MKDATPDAANAEAPVLLTRDGPVAALTLNRPAQRNCVDARVAAALRDALARIEADPAIRVAVLSGAGKVFCAGMDLKAFAAGEVEDVLFGEGRFAGLVGAERTKPLIAAVHGAALAGGFEIALACDVIVAERDAVFGLPEPGLGLVAGGGGAFRLGVRLPPAKAREILLTGRRIPAPEAEALGLVSALTEPGTAMAAAMDLARRIAANAPLAVAGTLRLARAAEREAEAALWPLNDMVLREMLESEDAAEGARAFAEKRQPAWSGR